MSVPVCVCVCAHEKGGEREGDDMLLTVYST